MKTADIVYFSGEPVSFGLGLCHQLHRHGPLPRREQNWRTESLPRR
jgi:hypothetical protein